MRMDAKLLHSEAADCGYGDLRVTIDGSRSSNRWFASGRFGLLVLHIYNYYCRCLESLLMPTFLCFCSLWHLVFWSELKGAEVKVSAAE